FLKSDFGCCSHENTISKRRTTREVVSGVENIWIATVYRWMKIISVFTGCDAGLAGEDLFFLNLIAEVNAEFNNWLPYLTKECVRPGSLTANENENDSRQLPY